MSEPVPLDPDDGPTAWVRTDGDGLIHFINGSRPGSPEAVVTLNRRELDRAAEIVDSR